MTQAAATNTRIRKDPRQRHVSGQAHTFDGTPAWTKLVNRRPDRHYVLVYKAGGESNLTGRYLELGYEVEKWGDPADKTRLRFGIGRGPDRAGEDMEFQGHVLMSIDLEEHQRIQQQGDGMGGGGQSYADRVERAIRRGTGVANPLRGRKGVFSDRLRLQESESLDGRYDEVEGDEE